MRKPFYLLLFVFVYTSGYAQFSLENKYNSFSDGDRLIKQQIEFKDPGRTGVNVLWDFSQQELINEEYPVHYYDEMDSLLVAREQRYLKKYLQKEDSLLLIRYENNQTLIDYNYPIVQLIFPVNYGDYKETYYMGTGNYCNLWDLTISGRHSYKVDSYGVLLLPDGEILQKVLRIHYKEEQIEKKYLHYNYSRPDSVFLPDSIAWHLANDSIILHTDTYQWYAEGYRYPVFESIEKKVYRTGELIDYGATSFYYPPHEQYYGLKEDTDNQQKREYLATEEERIKQAKEKRNDPAGEDLRSGETINYNLFMSPDGNTAFLEYYLSDPTEISVFLFDIQGRILIKFPHEKKNPGNYLVEFPMESYQKGEYLVQISANEKIYGEKIIKN